MIVIVSPIYLNRTQLILFGTHIGEVKLGKRATGVLAQKRKGNHQTTQNKYPHAHSSVFICSETIPNRLSLF